MKKPHVKRSGDTLIGQLVGANVLLVILAIVGAVLASDLDLSVDGQRWEFGIVVMAVLLSLVANIWILQRRFRPLERLIDQVEGVDPAEPDKFEFATDPSKEIERLSRSFKRLMDRISSERRRAGQLVVRAQEEERRRIARDLHDEVNQALTAILLRLRALEESTDEHAEEVGEVKRLAAQAMEELLNLARQLRPSALDDHGVVPAIEGLLRRFSEQSGIAVGLETGGELDKLGEDQQIAVYRVVQEALNNAGRHAGASRVDVDLASLNGDGLKLTVSDDGVGFDPAVGRPGGIGLKGMTERARLLGGDLDVRSSAGAGTSVTLRLDG